MSKKIKGNLNCPVCNSMLDGVTNIENEDVLPENGDFSVCLYCNTILQFETDDTGFKYKKVSIEELKTLQLENPTFFNQLAITQDVAKSYQDSKKSD
jgi:uncharacterized protein with PIN domain